ncbi:unnamed protein product [Rotaria socialis]
MQPFQNKQNLSLKTTVPSENDKIRLLSDLFDRVTNVMDFMEYHKNRCFTYYEANQYKAVIRCIPKRQVTAIYGEKRQYTLTFLVAVVLDLGCHIGEVRSTILNSLNVEMVNNRDAAINILTCISEEKVNKLIQRTSNNRLTKKIKRLN